MSALVALPPKTGKFILMLGSDADGEVVNAARALTRALKSKNLSLHDLVDRLDGRIEKKSSRPATSETSSTAPICWASLSRTERLDWLRCAAVSTATSDWEKAFAISVSYQVLDGCELSPKQIAISDRIFLKVWRKG